MSDSNNNSENQYSRYEIQKGDTLESIARNLNIELDDLRQYHNSRSKLEDCLAGKLKSHLKFLMVPNEKEEVIVEKNKLQPVQFISQEYILPFQTFELNHQYSVLYTIQKGESIQTLEQNFSVRRLKPDRKQDDYHFIEINKISELLIDGSPVSTKAYKVAEKMAEILYPLRIVVNKQGKWIDLNSYEKLKERWEKQKDNIRDSFDGVLYKTLANNVENVITDDKSLVNFLSGNWFLRTFFNGIHMAYTENFEIEKKLYFPAIAEVDDIEFNIKQKVNPYLNELNQIEVTQIGEAENEYLIGNYISKYSLNPNNYIVQQIKLECNMNMKKSREISLSIKNLDESKIILDSGISLFV